MQQVKFNGVDYNVVAENNQTLQLRRVGVVTGRTKSVLKTEVEYVDTNKNTPKETNMDKPEKKAKEPDVTELKTKKEKVDKEIVIPEMCTITDAFDAIKAETRPVAKIAIAKAAIAKFDDMETLLAASKKSALTLGIGSKRMEKLMSELKGCLNIDDFIEPLLEKNKDYKLSTNIRDFYAKATALGKRFELTKLEKYEFFKIVAGAEQMTYAKAFGKELALGMSDKDIDIALAK